MQFKIGQTAVIVKSKTHKDHAVVILDVGPWKRGTWVRGQLTTEDTDYYVLDHTASKTGFVTETQLQPVG